MLPLELGLVFSSLQSLSLLGTELKDTSDEKSMPHLLHKN